MNEYLREDGIGERGRSEGLLGLGFRRVCKGNC
jgi:hypothetical protein